MFIDRIAGLFESAAEEPAHVGVVEHRAVLGRPHEVIIEPDLGRQPAPELVGPVVAEQRQGCLGERSGSRRRVGLAVPLDEGRWRGRRERLGGRSDESSSTP